MIKVSEPIRKVERYRIQAAWCPPSRFKLGIILGTMSSAYVGPLDFMSGYWPALSPLESIRYSTDDERQKTQKCRWDEGCYYSNLCSTTQQRQMDHLNTTPHWWHISCKKSQDHVLSVYTVNYMITLFIRLTFLQQESFFKVKCNTLIFWELKFRVFIRSNQ